MFYFSLFILFILFYTNEAMICPEKYNFILNGCYKIHNGTTMTWNEARKYCLNETNRISVNKTDYITHLVALESAIESTSLIYWMKAWTIQSQFWIDGISSTSSWNWSGQTITWYINSTDRIIHGNGSNYRLIYSSNQNTYQIDDANNNQLSHFICEYQDRCSTNNSCQNNATCYLNVGRELCICAPGYTGATCNQQIDECLSSPCKHGGLCIDHLNNYTCDCSNIFFNGPNCETPNHDPTKSQRSAAFWSVFGIVCGLVILLTLSDVPWDEITSTIGCPWYKFKCCLNPDEDDGDDENIDVNNLRLNDSSTTENNIITKEIVPGKTSRGINYHIMNTVWNPEQLRTETPLNPQYNGYQSPDQRTTPNNVLIQSFAAVVLAKQKEKQLEEKRVYAVDIIEENDSTIKTKNPADTMVSWTKQLQEQLKNKQPIRTTSANSTKELVESEVINEN